MIIIFGMLWAILLLAGLSFSEVLVLSTDLNEASFSVREVRGKVCVAGRIDSDGRGYDALLGTLGGVFYRVSSERDDYSYTLESFEGSCLAGVTTLERSNMDMCLVSFGEGSPKIERCFGGDGDDMLWYVKKVKGGYLLVGGVYTGNWDILVVKLSDRLELIWVLRLGTERDEYAYGVVQRGSHYYVVGRSNYRSNWDGFLLEISENGQLERARLVGGKGKDYFRFVELFKKEIIMVGRTEAGGSSDVLLCTDRRGCFAYDCGDFDYGRVFVPWRGGIALMGDTYKEGQSDGLLLFLDESFRVKRSFRIGGEDVESVRFLTPEGWFAGYTYSFTLDNDVMIGNIKNLSGYLFKEKTCSKVKAHVNELPYPLSAKPYELKELNLKFLIYRVTLKKLKHPREF